MPPANGTTPSEKARAASRAIDSVEAEDVLGGIRELINQVDWRLPRGFYRDERMWPVMGHALIARMRDTIDSIAQLVPTRRESDALVLLRVLYEHVVTFCWLAIDPEPHMREWWGDTDHHRLKQVREAASFGVQDLMTDKEMKDTEDAEKMIGVADRAQAAEAHWAPLIRGFRGPKHLLSLRGLYTVLFREASGSAHATAQSVVPVIEDGDWTKPRWRVFREDTDRLFWHALSVPVFCHALLVCHYEFDWPDADVVRGINNALLREESGDVADRPAHLR